MAGDQRFDFDSLQDNQSIQLFLQSLMEGFKKGKIVLSSENDEIALFPDSILRFSVKAKKKSDMKNHITIKIAWKEPKSETRETARSIKIHSET